MGHHPRCHSVLVVTVHHLVFSCQLGGYCGGDANEGIPARRRGVSISEIAMLRQPLRRLHGEEQ
jgi:hypothetical protein